MYCKHCGNQIENDSKFCSFCGEKLELLGQISQTLQSFSEADVDQITVVDIDGNVYKTVRIGRLIWMAENLRVSRYRDGYLIPHVENLNEWGGLGKGAWCNSDNDNDTDKKVYNWYAVNDNRGLAPKGWHVPSDEEWETLITFLGNEEITNPNNSDSIKDIFSGIVGGFKVDDNPLNYIGTYGDWWSSTGHKAYYSWNSKVYYDDSYVGRSSGVMTNGFSVRCVMDY